MLNFSLFTLLTFQTFPTFQTLQTMADNFLERQYAAYEERKASLAKGKKPKKSSVKFYTRVPVSPVPESVSEVCAEVSTKN